MSRGKYSPVAQGDSDDNGHFIGNEVGRQQLEMTRQDETLDVLSDSISRLGQLSLTISNELDEQNRMLDDLDEDYNEAQSKLEFATKRIRDLAKKSGGWGWLSVIALLTAIIVFLLFVVLYT